MSTGPWLTDEQQFEKCQKQIEGLNSYLQSCEEQEASTKEKIKSINVIVNKKVPKMSEKIPHLFYRERHPYRCHIPFYYVFS